jgi:glycosyltransferase involved in cell wall biosynthesis
VFHATETALRPVAATAVVATVHDMGALRGVVPAGGADLERARVVFGRALGRADVVLAVSQAALDDLVHAFPEHAGRARVVYPALIPTEPVAVPACRGAYVAFVGATNRRKDLDVLLHGVALLREAGEWPGGVSLVVAGPAGDFEAGLLRLSNGLGISDLVRRIGYLPSDGAVEDVIRHAVCFAYPGRHEGFGFPALRAMAAGVPVVACASAAIPEVTAGAAALFPPGDSEALAAQLGRLLNEPAARDRAAAAGRERAKAFSLRRFGEELLSAYGEALRRATLGP